jgi:hypothetical protein
MVLDHGQQRKRAQPVALRIAPWNEEKTGYVAQVMVVFLNTSNFGHLLEKMRGVLTRGLGYFLTKLF